MSRKISEENLITLKKHWSQTAVLTDTYTSDTPVQEVSEEELLPGELYAEQFLIGCYLVRSAIRMYQIYTPGYTPEKEVPANAEETARMRTEYGKYDRNVSYAGLHFDYQHRRTQEITAHHIHDTSGKFTYICRAAEARNVSWTEVIKAICTAKKCAAVPECQASLFVQNTFMGDCWDANTWYQLDCTGKITQLRLHDMDFDKDNARFE